MLHEESDGKYRMGPNNIITSWFWVAGDPERPVRLFDLKAAFLSGEGVYHPDILASLDKDDDGDLSAGELRLDTEEKVAAVSARLRQVGAVNPRIKGEIQPYTHSHGVATGAFVMGGCRSCHSRTSRINQAVELSGFVPGGVLPEPVKDSHTKTVGTLQMTETGGLFFRPALDPHKLYIHGTLRPQWLDIIGILIVLASLAGVILHGGLRIVAAKKRGKKKDK
jgi:hypothetical protein